MIRKLLILTTLLCSTVTTFSFAGSTPEPQTLRQLILPHSRSIDNLAEYLSEASYFKAKWGSCSRRCKKNMKKYAKGLVRLIHAQKIEQPEVVQAIVIQSFLKAHQYNQGTGNSAQANLLADPFLFDDFQKQLTKQIQKQARGVLRKSLIVIGAAGLVLVTGGYAAYAGAIAFWGGTWQIIASSLITGGVTGSLTYYFVSKPWMEDYDQSTMQGSQLDFLMQKLEDIPSEETNLEERP